MAMVNKVRKQVWISALVPTPSNITIPTYVAAVRRYLRLAATYVGMVSVG